MNKSILLQYSDKPTMRRTYRYVTVLFDLQIVVCSLTLNIFNFELNTNGLTLPNVKEKEIDDEISSSYILGKSIRYTSSENENFFISVTFMYSLAPKPISIIKLIGKYS